MPMTIYKLFADVAGDGVASLDIQLDGTIKSIHMSMALFGIDSLNEGAYAEVSFLSTNTFNNNDARGSLMIVQCIFGFITSGGLNSTENASISSLEIPVSAGERIHLHLADAGALTGRNCHAFLYVEDKGMARIPGRRR